MFIYLVIQLISVACFCGVLAEEKGRSGVAWFFIGVFFTIPALLTLIGLPAVPKHDATATVR